MSIAAPGRLTTEQLLEMPDDGKERLIRGELREKEKTRRSFGHSRVQMKIGQLLLNWSESRPAPRGIIVGGEAGVRLRRDPDTTVGVDVAYLSPETADANPNEEPVHRGRAGAGGRDPLPFGQAGGDHREGRELSRRGREHRVGG